MHKKVCAFVDATCWWCWGNLYRTFPQHITDAEKSAGCGGLRHAFERARLLELCRVRSASLGVATIAYKLVTPQRWRDSW